jgi:hypothetical protein
LSFRDLDPAWQSMACLLTIGSGALVPSVAAAQARIELGADASIVASDNPFLIPGGNTAAIAGQITARPSLTWTIAPATTVQADMAIGLRQYDRRYGNFLLGRAEADIRHRSSEYFSAFGSVSYARELSTETAVNNIDSAIASVGVVTSYAARSTLTWNPNARTSVVGDLAWNRVSRPGSLLVSTANYRDLSINFSRRVSPLTSFGVETELSWGDAGTGGQSKAQAARLTATRRLSSDWRGNLKVGVERLDASGGFAPPSSATIQFSGSGEFCYEPQHLVACLTAAVRSGTSGLGGLQREVVFGGSLNRKLSLTSSLAATAEYRRSRLGLLAQPVDMLRLTASYDRRLNRRVSLTAGGDYLRRTGLAGERVSAAVLRVGVTIRDFL